MLRSAITIVLLLLCRSACALTAAQIQSSYDRAIEQYTIPEGVHELEAYIRIRPNKRLLARQNSVLIVRGNHYAAHADGVKNFYVALGRVFHLSRADSGYSTAIFFNKCSQFVIGPTSITGGWAGVTLHHCSDWSAYHVLANGASSSTGWMLAGCHRFTMLGCEGCESGWEGMRLIADNRDGLIFGGQFCRNGRVMPNTGAGHGGGGIEIGQGGENIRIINVTCSENIGVGLMVKSSHKPDEIYHDGIPYGLCKNISATEVTANNNGSHGVYVQWSQSPGVPQPEGISLDRVNARGNAEAGVWADANGITVTNSVLKHNKDGLVLFKSCKEWSESGNIVVKNSSYQKLVPTDYR